VRRLHRTKARLQDACIDAMTYDAGFQAVEAVEVISPSLPRGFFDIGSKLCVFLQHRGYEVQICRDCFLPKAPHLW